MQKHVNLVDLVKSFPTHILLQNLASIQKRTSPIKFAHLAEKSEKGSMSNLSTQGRAAAKNAAGGPLSSLVSRAGACAVSLKRVVLDPRLDCVLPPSTSFLKFKETNSFHRKFTDPIHTVHRSRACLSAPSRINGSLTYRIQILNLSVLEAAKPRQQPALSSFAAIRGLVSERAHVVQKLRPPQSRQP